MRAAAPAVLGGLAAIRRPPRTAGATDCAHGWGGGGLSASYLSVGFLLFDSSYRLPPPLGVGGGLAGAMAAPSAIAPALGHLNFRGIGRKADGFSRHRTNNQGGLPPYLRAAIVPGQGGRLCRGTRPCPGSMAAVII